MRNREMLLFFWLCLLVCVPFWIIALAVSFEMFVLCLCMAAVLLLCFLIFMQWRYHRLRLLNDQMRRVREGNYQMNPQDYREGELSILHSEIYKVTVELREKAQQLQENQQFLSDSLSDISHQLKTPLTSMMMMVDLMQEEGMSEKQRHEFLATIASQLTRMRWLIQSLLKMAKLEAGAVQFLPSPVSVRSLINKALSQAETEIVRARVEYVVSCPEDFMLLLDENWTAEALGNILRNCAEHTPPQGQIRIDCRHNALVDEIIIEDTGEGIAPEDLPHLFERFYRGQNAKEDSVGIGLAMSHQILISQNGTLQAESRRGQGSRFKIRFIHQVV